MALAKTCLVLAKALFVLSNIIGLKPDSIDENCCAEKRLCSYGTPKNCVIIFLHRLYSYGICDCINNFSHKEAIL